MQIEQNLHLQNQESALSVFEALYDLYDAVEGNQTAQTFVDGYMFDILNNINIIKCFTLEQRTCHLAKIQEAKELAEEMTVKPKNLIKIIAHLPVLAHNAA